MALTPRPTDFNIPGLSQQPLTADGKAASPAFIRIWQQMRTAVIAALRGIQGQVDSLAAIQRTQAAQQAQLLAQNAQILQALGIANSATAAAAAAAAAANQAQTDADSGGSATARSGSATGSASIFNTGWMLGPTVNLLTVSAGNLTITGTGITAGALTDGSLVIGQFRVVELAGGTTIFPGVGDSNTFSVSDGGVAMDPSTIASVAAFSLAEVTTGSVSYRMDVRRSGGPVGGTADVDLYFYARRS